MRHILCPSGPLNDMVGGRWLLVPMRLLSLCKQHGCTMPFAYYESSRKRLRNVVFQMPKSIFAIYSIPNTFKIAEKQHEQFTGAS